MAPIDFEKELQERMRSREVKPSPEAWDRISARLDEEGPVASRKPRLWIGLAAASVLVLLGFLFLRKPVEALPLLDPVVDSPKTEIPVQKSAGIPEDTTPEGKEDQGGALVTVETAPQDQEETGMVKAQNRDAYDKGHELAENTNPVLTEREEMPQVSIGVAGSEEASMTQGSRTEPQPGRAQEDEIEALLNQARESIALQKDQDTLRSVDAMALLDRAEDELDQTFREKIMDKLKTGVNKLRTAVAERKN